MATLGIIGSGRIGTAIARLAVNAGIDVVMANSRGPQTLADLVSELGERATAGTPEQAAAAGDQVVVTIPLENFRALPAESLAGKVVLDTMNYYPHRDGRIPALDSEQLTTSEMVQEHLSGASTVKVFNNIFWSHIPEVARPAGAPDRSALPIAGNDAQAKVEAAALISALGFETVDVGALADAWRFEPETRAYVRPYAADRTASMAQIRDGAPAGPLSAADLRSLLNRAERVRVADRTF